MTHKEFQGWLQQVEARYPVQDWRVGGIRIWPMVRTHIYGANFHARTAAYSIGAGARGYARIVLESLSGWARATLTDAAANRRPTTTADAVFLTYSVGRQPVLGGRHYNPLLAPFVEILVRKGLAVGVWETSPFGDYNTPRSTPSALVQPWLLWDRVGSQLRRHFALDVALEGYDAFLSEVDGAEFSIAYRDRRRLLQDAWFIRRLADRYKRWLLQAGAWLGFAADASHREQAFCLACRELGIISVELQHGVQGVMHPTYAGWNSVPPDGFELRPRVFWSWDESSAAAINAWAAGAGAGAHRAIVGGDPWREMWVSGTSETASVARRAVAERRAARNGEAHVLVTLSSNRDVLPHSVMEAVRRAPAGWRWWFRMHPVNQQARLAETRRLLADLGQDLELLTFATTIPLFALLPAMQAHVTVGMSTVVQEAAAFGVPSVGCMQEAEDFYAAERAAGVIRVALDADAMLAALEWAVNNPVPVRAGARPDPAAAMDQVLALARDAATGPGRRR